MLLYKIVIKLKFHQGRKSFQIIQQSISLGWVRRKGRVVVILLVPWNYALIGELDLNSYYSACKEYSLGPRTAISEYILKRKSRKPIISAPSFSSTAQGKGSRCYGNWQEEFFRVIFADFKVLLFPGG